LKVGIPRALHYYYYEDLWLNFFKNLNIQTVVSPLTNKQIIKQGIANTIDEACYSSKIFIGHVEWLLDKCDLIFVPRIENVGLREEYCTRLFGIYDLVVNTFPQAKLLHADINFLRRKKEPEAFAGIGAALGKTPEEVTDAYVRATETFINKKEQRILEQNKKLESKETKVLLVSHAYNTYDASIGQNVIKYFKENGAEVIFADIIDYKEALLKAREAYKRIYWRANAELLGGLLTYKDKVDGIVLLSTFPCAPDSIINDLILKSVKDKPILQLMIDEQDANAGLMTRLESFMDILNATNKTVTKPATDNPPGKFPSKIEGCCGSSGVCDKGANNGRN